MAALKTEAEKLAYARKKIREDYMSNVNYHVTEFKNNIERQVDNLMNGLGPNFTDIRKNVMEKKLTVWARELMTDTYPRQVMGGRKCRNPVVEVNNKLDFIKLIYAPDCGSFKPYLVVEINHKMAGASYRVYSFNEEMKMYRRGQDIREIETLRLTMEDELIRRYLLV